MRISDWSSDVCSSDLVGIDDGHAMLALADAPACRLRLGVCQPRLRRPAMLDDGAPQDQDVDARIIARGERIARQAGSGGRAPTFGASSPRLDPRQDIGRASCWERGCQYV